MDDDGDGTGEPTTAEPALRAGTRVEVRNAFDGTWSKGFTVVEVTASGYRIRRRSDDVRIPTVFSADEVRRERRRSTWWV